MTPEVMITLSLCVTALFLAVLLFLFPWARVLSVSNRALLDRMQDLASKLEDIRRHVAKSHDELERQVTRLAHDQETVREHFAHALATIEVDKSTLAEMVHGLRTRR